MDELAGATWVEAEMYQAHEIETEDICALQLATQSGVHITALTSFCAAPPEVSVSIVECEDARIEIHDFETIHVCRPGSSVEVRTVGVAGREQMFLDLHAAWREGRPFPVNVGNTLSFPRALNLAWESAAPVTRVPESELTRVAENGMQWLRLGRTEISC